MKYYAAKYTIDGIDFLSIKELGNMSSELIDEYKAKGYHILQINIPKSVEEFLIVCRGKLNASRKKDSKFCIVGEARRYGDDVLLNERVTTYDSIVSLIGNIVVKYEIINLKIEFYMPDGYFNWKKYDEFVIYERKHKVSNPYKDALLKRNDEQDGDISSEEIYLNIKSALFEYIKFINDGRGSVALNDGGLRLWADIRHKKRAHASTRFVMLDDYKNLGKMYQTLQSWSEKYYINRVYIRYTVGNNYSLDKRSIFTIGKSEVNIFMKLFTSEDDTEDFELN